MGGGLRFKEKKRQISSHRTRLWQGRLHQVSWITSVIILGASKKLNKT